MPGNSTYTRDQIGNWITGQASPPATGTRYAALFTAVGTDAGTGFTEAAFTGYARVAVTSASWNAPTGTAPVTVSTSAVITWPTCTGSPGANIIAWGLYDASTAGNLIEWDYLWAGGSSASGAWLPFTATAASPSVLTAPAHGFANGDSVVVNGTVVGTLPTLSAGSWSGLLTVAGATTDAFNVGLNTTTTGSGLVRKVVPQAMVTNLTVQVPTGDLVLVQS